jgi:hypothetical protein
LAVTGMPDSLWEVGRHDNDTLGRNGNQSIASGVGMTRAENGRPS